MLYLDPYYFSIDDIIPKSDIKIITVIAEDYSRKGKKRKLKLPINEKTTDPFQYIMTYIDENDKIWAVKKIIINNEIEISCPWWDDIFLIADKETILRALEKHKTDCKPKELEVINKLPGNLNKYFKIDRDSSLDVKRMRAAKLLRHIHESDLYAEKAEDILNFYEEDNQKWIRQQIVNGDKSMACFLK
jgi:hypothetical protein